MPEIENRNSRHLILEKASVSDLNLVFNWANDAETRANSFNSQAISLSDHSDWYLRKIEDPGCSFFICYSATDTVGQIRFDRTPADEYVISFGVAPEQRGKGYGSLILQAGMEQLKATLQTPIHFIGYVKMNNSGSNRIFEKLGFTKSVTTDYPESYRYDLYY